MKPFIIIAATLFALWIGIPAAMAQAAVADPEKVIMDRQGVVAAAAAGDTNRLGEFFHEQNSVNARNPQGRTALMIAAINRHFDTVKFLVNKGADVNALDLDGYSAMALMVGLGGVSGEIGRYLQSHGAVVCVPWDTLVCPEKSKDDLEEFKTAVALSDLPEQ